MSDLRRYAPATARNRAPILDVLRPIVPEGAAVLEIASGSGEHAVYLAPRLGVARWQPTDPDPDARASIDAWREAEDAPTVLPARALDVVVPDETLVGEVGVVDLVVSVNMIHIAPWEATLRLFHLARRVLGPPARGGRVFLYGPFRRAEVVTASSNEAFDASLRARNPAWGLRDLEAVVEVGRAHGFALAGVTPMPANNLSVVLC